MSYFGKGTNDIFSLASSIVKREYKKDNWLSVLNILAKIFDADGAFIGFWKKGFIELKYSSSLIKSYEDNDLPKLQKINIKDRKEFRDKLIKNRYIKIEDYENYPYALKEWKNIGLKSLLIASISTSLNTYGSLHIVSLNKKIEFSEKDIESLRIIANTIASEIEKELLFNKLEKEQAINTQYINLINSMALKNEIPQKINDWIVETLRKIKLLAESDIISFIFPKENICTILNDLIFATDCNEIKESFLLDLFRKNIKNIIKNTNNLQKCGLYHVKSTFIIPVVSGNETIAILCMGYINQTDIDDKRMNMTQSAVKYLLSLIYMYKNISKITSQLSETEEGLIKAFVSSMEAKDIYTKGHSEHVALYAKNIGKLLGFDDKEQESLHTAGLLHDIGKIGIPDNILLKPGKLSPYEYKIIKLHPIFSYEIVKNIPKLKPIAKCILHHHEKLDGSGYPYGLKDSEIEIGARILAIADIFDALTTNRPYRNSLSPEQAIKILQTEPVDQTILSKIKDHLKILYINELSFQTTFVPKEFEATRKEIIERDYFTGFYRRNALIKIIRQYIKSNKIFTLFMVDIKNISYINYKYSVETADKVILFVAEELSKLSVIDGLSRIGVDVFMFIYVGSNPSAFKDKMYKNLKQGIINKIKQKSCIIEEREAEEIIGCYIEYAEYPKEATDPEGLIYKCVQKKKSSKSANENIHT